jgi:hypothetical protein
MICPRCSGEKIQVVLGCPGARILEIACSDCNGTGVVDDRYFDWVWDGDQMKERRRKEGLTLSRFCNRAKMDAAAVSRMERGLDDPRPLIDWWEKQEG